MREDGILKALAGVTTLMEVERVTEGEEMVDEE
jgi:type II secretory ATPase GspE/PulE/Tfp pilus assembly ATPase PilB-like protein